MWFPGGLMERTMMLVAPRAWMSRKRGLLVALADRHHHDHRRHAQDDAQAGEHAAQLVQAQVVQAEAECFEEEGQRRILISDFRLTIGRIRTQRGNATWRADRQSIAPVRRCR